MDSMNWKFSIPLTSMFNSILLQFKNLVLFGSLLIISIIAYNNITIQVDYIDSLSRFFKYFSSSAILIISTVVLTTLIFLTCSAFNKKKQFIILSTIFVFISHYIFVTGYSSELTSDFKYMDFYLREIMLSIGIFNDYMLGDRMTDIVHNRLIFPYYVFFNPISFFINDSVLIIKIINVFLISSAYLAFSLTVLKKLGFKSVLIFTILFFLWPERFYSSLIISHDIASVFLISLITYLYFSKTENRSFSFIVIIVLSLLLTILDMTRSLAFILILGFLFSNLEKGRKSNLYKILILSFLSIAILFIGKQASIIRSVPAQDLWFLTLSSSYSKGTNAEHKLHQANYLVELSKDEYILSKKMSVNAALYEFVFDPYLRLSNMYYRSLRLSFLGNSYGLYMKNNIQSNDILPDYKEIKFINRLYGLLLCVFFIASSFILFFRKECSSIVYYSASVSAMSILAFVCFGENQPRYISIFMPLMFIIVSGVFCEKNTNNSH